MTEIEFIGPNWFEPFPTFNENIDPDVGAIITPHAGFAHSGSISSKGFEKIDRSQFTNAFILATNHKDSSNYKSESNSIIFDNTVFHFIEIDNFIDSDSSSSQ